MQTRGHKADFAHFLIELGEQLLSLLWPAADARRAASLEIIARTAYTAEESACHYLETIGLDQSGAIRKTLELARRPSLTWTGKRHIVRIPWCRNRCAHEPIFHPIA